MPVSLRPGFAAPCAVLAAVLAAAASGMSVRERFDMADETYRTPAARGEAEWDRAIAMYRYLQNNGESKRRLEKARLRLSEVNMGAGKPEACDSALDRAVELDADRRDWALYRKAMLLMGRAADAPTRAKGRALRNRGIATCRRVAEEPPDPRRAPEALFYVGNNLFKHKYRGRPAVKAFTKLIRRYPESREARIAAKLIPRLHFRLHRRSELFTTTAGEPALLGLALGLFVTVAALAAIAPDLAADRPRAAL